MGKHISLINKIKSKFKTELFHYIWNTKITDIVIFVGAAFFFILSPNRFKFKDWGAQEYSSLSFILFVNIKVIARLFPLRKCQKKPKDEVQNIDKIISSLPKVNGKLLVSRSQTKEWHSALLDRRNKVILYKLAFSEHLNWVDYVAFKVLNKFSADYSPVVLFGNVAPLNNLKPNVLKGQPVDFLNTYAQLFIGPSAKVETIQDLFSKLNFKANYIFDIGLPQVKWLFKENNFNWYATRWERPEEASGHFFNTMIWNFIIYEKYIKDNNSVLLLQWEKTKELHIHLENKADYYILLFKDLQIAGRDGKTGYPGQLLNIQPSENKITGFKDIRNWINSILEKEPEVRSLTDLERFCLLIKCKPMEDDIEQLWKNENSEIYKTYDKLRDYFKDNKNIYTILPETNCPNDPDKSIKIILLIANEFVSIDEKWNVTYENTR